MGGRLRRHEMTPETVAIVPLAADAFDSRQRAAMARVQAAQVLRGGAHDVVDHRSQAQVPAVALRLPGVPR